MRYFAIDIRCTGRNPAINQILEIACICETTQDACEIKNLPRFHRYLVHHQLTFEPVYLAKKWDLIQAIIKDEHKEIERCKPFDLAEQFKRWVKDVYGLGLSQPLVWAGENIHGHVLSFLNQVMYWPQEIKSVELCLDPTSIYTNPDKDVDVPTLVECAARIGLHIDETPLQRCEATIALLRRAWQKEVP